MARPSTPKRASASSQNFRHPLGVEAGADRMYQQADHIAHIDEMIRQLILTDHGERVMRPTLGTTLKGLVFEPLRGATSTMIRASVFASLRQHLGDLIKVIAVQTEVDEATLRVRIVYQILSHPGRRVLEMETAI